MIETVCLDYTDEGELVISKEDLFNVCMLASFVTANETELSDEEMEKYCKITADFSAVLLGVLFPDCDNTVGYGTDEDGVYSAEDIDDVGGYA